MLHLEPYPTIDALEKDLENPSLLRILAILTILIPILPIAFVISWSEKLYGYSKNFLSLKKISYTNYANK